MLARFVFRLGTVAAISAAAVTSTLAQRQTKPLTARTSTPPVPRARTSTSSRTARVKRHDSARQDRARRVRHAW